MQKQKRGPPRGKPTARSSQPILPVVAPSSNHVAVDVPSNGNVVAGYVRGRAEDSKRLSKRAPSPKDQRSKLAREMELEGRGRCLRLGTIVRLILLFAIVFNVLYYVLGCVGGNCSLDRLTGPLFSKSQDVVEEPSFADIKSDMKQVDLPPASPPPSRDTSSSSSSASSSSGSSGSSGSYKAQLTDAQKKAGPKLQVKPQKPFEIPNSEPSISVDEPTKTELLMEEWDRKDMRELASRVKRLRKISELWYQAHAFVQGGGKPSKMSDQEFDDFKLFVGDAERAMYPFIPPTYESLADWKYTVDKEGGRGIVMVIIAPQQVKPVIGSLKALRVSGCKLPIQIFHDGRGAIDGGSVSKLEGVEGVEVKSVLTYLPQDRIDQITKHFYLKAFSILFSKFREVISMDPDVFFFQNPEAAIFSDPNYEKNAVLFFKDRMELNPHSEKQAEWLKEFMPNAKSLDDNRYYKGTANYFMDAGVVGVDKSKHFWGLLGVASISWGQAREAWTSLVLEKESFWAGFELADDHDYAFEPHAVGAIGNLVRVDVNPYDSVEAFAKNPSPQVEEMYRPDEYDIKPGKETGKVCGPHLFHPDYTGERPLWMNNGLTMNPWDPKSPFTKLEAWVPEAPGRWDMANKGSYVFCIKVEAGRPQIRALFEDELKFAEASAKIMKTV